MTTRFLPALASVLTAAAIVFPGSAAADDVAVSNAFARASAGPARNGAAYMEIGNKAAQPDTLIAARSPVSAKVELHTHIHENGVMRMREVEGGIALPAGQTTRLAPGGLHVMLMGLHDPLKEGSHFPLTLIFRNAGEMTVSVPVLGVGAMAPGGTAAPRGHGH